MWIPDESESAVAGADQAKEAEARDSSDKMKELIRYWQTEYDWRKAEQRLNALPQFVTTSTGRKFTSFTSALAIRTPCR